MWAWIKLIAICSITLLIAKLIHAIVSWYRGLLRLRTMVSEPGPGHWLLGHVKTNPKEVRGYDREMMRKMPRKFLRRMGPRIAVQVVHPETVADVMRKNPARGEFVFKMLKTWLGNGLFTTTGKRWSRDRSLLSHAFTANMRRGFVDSFKDVANIMLDIWEPSVGQAVKVSDYFTLLTFDVILRCVMGVETDCLTANGENTPTMRYCDNVKQMGEILQRRMLRPWYYPEFIFMNSPIGWRFKKLMDENIEFCETIISQRRALLAEEAGKPSARRTDMLDTLLTVRDEEGTGLSDTDIREQVDTFLAAGHASTTSTMEWIIHYLSEHQDVQDRCRDEVRGVVDKCGGIEELSHSHLADFAYLTQTIQETQRISSVATMLSVTATKETPVDGVTFPAETPFMVSILSNHNNEQVWTDPDTFNPDRFAPENYPSNPYAFIPFGTGPRSCIGKHFAMDEIKVVMAMILMKFRLLPDPEAERPHWERVMIGIPAPYVSVRIEAV